MGYSQADRVRIAAGMCVTCTHAYVPAVPGKRRCAKCAQDAARYSRHLRNEAKLKRGEKINRKASRRRPTSGAAAQVSLAASVSDSGNSPPEHLEASDSEGAALRVES